VRVEHNADHGVAVATNCFYRQAGVVEDTKLIGSDQNNLAARVTREIGDLIEERWSGAYGQWHTPAAYAFHKARRGRELREPDLQVWDVERLVLQNGGSVRGEWRSPGGVDQRRVTGSIGEELGVFPHSAGLHAGGEGLCGPRIAAILGQRCGETRRCDCFPNLGIGTCDKPT